MDVQFFQVDSFHPFLRMLAFGLAPMLVSFVCYKFYLKTSWLKAIGIGVLASVVCNASAVWRIMEYESQHKIPGDTIILYKIIPGAILFFFLFPLAFQLYGKWIGDRATEAERTPGWEGFKAWLSPGNLVCCAGIAICACLMSYPDNSWAKLAKFSLMVFPVLWIYPLINTVDFYLNRREQSVDTLSAAHTKILKMLEEDKIDAQECAELLSALKEPAPHAKQEPPPQPQSNPSSEETV